MNAIVVAVIVLVFGISGFGLGNLVLMVMPIVILLAVQLIWRQESMLYVPCPMPGMQRCQGNPDGYKHPMERGLRYEDVRLVAADGVKLHGWFMPAQLEPGHEPAGTLLFCHANAGNIGMRIPNFERLVRNLRLNVMAFDYRGYGDSEGEPSEEGLLLDADAAWAWVEEKAKIGHCDVAGGAAVKVDGEKLYIFGRSVGGAVAVGLAANLQKRRLEAEASEKPAAFAPKGLVLENTFTSISDLVDSLFPWIAYAWLKKTFLRLHWKSEDRIRDLDLPLLFLSAGQDEIVPAENCRRLHLAATASRLNRLVSFPEAMHNDTWEKGGPKYWWAFKDFLEHCCLLGALPQD